MSRQITGVLLGFVDESITDKYKDQVNHTTNKIGGIPDLPSDFNLDLPKCPLCHLVRSLVVQIYAPLENCNFQRTLYLFACINPNCWNSSESWICFRVQAQEKVADFTKNSLSAKASATDWCADADDWNDENANNEENGNVLKNACSKLSDEDDESLSLDDNINFFSNLSVNDNHNVNKGDIGGAVGKLHLPIATAEIEGNEGEVISIDTPTFPQRDITALLQEVVPVPQEVFQLSSKNSPQLQFHSSFISVTEETIEKFATNISDSHVKELLQVYQHENDFDNLIGCDKELQAQSVDNYENYEKSSPIHGDKMFHRFISKIQNNPTQILRYERKGIPLLIHPLQEIPKKCHYCNGDVVFEFQLVPTIISKLQLVTDAMPSTRVEFGTILIFTCLQSCWSTDASLRIETTILQMET